VNFKIGSKVFWNMLGVYAHNNMPTTIKYPGVILDMDHANAHIEIWDHHENRKVQRYVEKRHLDSRNIYDDRIDK
jgi:hypothetical protein